MTTVQSIVHKSRWGFHACSHDTYLKLKKLHKFYWKAVYRNAEWKRWNRKEPQNRILVKWYRNEKGQKTGYEVVGPKPEPKLYPVFGQKWYGLNDMGILSAYATARHPYATAEEVPQLGLTNEQIDSMLTHLEAFEAK